MSLQSLLDARPTFYVGVDATGEIIKVYNDVAKIESETDPRMVSWGILETMVLDYDELWRVGDGLPAHTEGEVPIDAPDA